MWRHPQRLDWVSESASAHLDLKAERDKVSAGLSKVLIKIVVGSGGRV
jgi:hypothetical protein